MIWQRKVKERTETQWNPGMDASEEMKLLNRLKSE